jgi:site-specific DNA-methyltransferase (adenine-specific)
MTAARQAAFALRGRNPDVLTCIANLSNDEVFTPPELANRMLDMLASAWAAANGGEDPWTNPDLTFLDPFTKSGVFLREITTRLTKGLEAWEPDLRKRVDHILTKQVFGIGITYLTSMLARRSLYCSKYANGPHSVAQSFGNERGNIWFQRIEHSWVGATEFVETANKKSGNPIKRGVNGRCKFCGASQIAFDRGDALESHAYAFLHTDDNKALLSKIFGADMQFDVIIGNPPYQMTGGAGGTNDSPLYNIFIERAKALEPRFLTMVVPSRWMAGGRGLADFRAGMLGDGHTRVLVDYENAKDLFPTIGIIGGVCYFLWDRENPGTCECTYHRNGVTVGPQERTLDEFDVFVRDPRALSILHKVRALEEPTFDSLVSGDTPFGLATNFTAYKRDAMPSKGELRLYANVGTTRVQGAVPRRVIKKNTHLIDVWKVLIPKTGSGRERERSGIDLVLAPSIVAGPGTVCTQTYLVIGPLEGDAAAKSVASYLRTRFARFAISLRKISQDAPRGVYAYLPTQTWDRIWTDAALYKKYRLTKEEQAYIESQIRPVESTVLTTND